MKLDCNGPTLQLLSSLVVLVPARMLLGSALLHHPDANAGVMNCFYTKQTFIHWEQVQSVLLCEQLGKQ